MEMALWNLPPKAKIYEAFSALADGRVTLGLGGAKVVSSSGDKTYLVRWSEDQASFASNDNASIWQGYAGYPIVAVLLALGQLPYDPAVADKLAGVEWKKLNTKFKRDYDKAVEHVLSSLDPEGRELVITEVDRVYRQLASMELGKLTARSQ